MSHLISCICLFISLSSLNLSAAELSSDQDKLSYTLGINIGEQFRNQIITVNTALFTKGLEDGLNNHPPQLSPKEIQEVMTKFQSEQLVKNQQQSQKLGEKNLNEGKTFLEKNKTQADVISLPSGLQYKIMKAGTGPTPTVTDTVSVHYKGTLINGTEFDSSYTRGTPATFPVNGVIPGWVEALKLMKQGSKWILYIPSHLAYGEQGAGRLIGPNATLIFEVELLSIKNNKNDDGRVLEEMLDETDEG
ncbi:MAG: hypothetical protein JWM09_570 [Francisellaceae bacterium]|nr:hypothetical protein [Francisellaceae bacterium]